MAAIREDLRYATRALRKQPGFTAVAVLTLALGIGANVAIFSVLHALLLKPLPYGDAARLMFVHLLVPDRDAGAGVYREGVWSYPKYTAFRERQQAFDQMALFGSREWSLTDTSDPERLRGELVGASFFTILGAAPQVGRGFLPEEDLASNSVARGRHRPWALAAPLRRRYGGCREGDRDQQDPAHDRRSDAARFPGSVRSGGHLDPAHDRGRRASSRILWSHSGLSDRPARNRTSRSTARRPRFSSFASAMNELFPPKTGPHWGVAATPLEGELAPIPAGALAPSSCCSARSAPSC